MNSLVDCNPSTSEKWTLKPQIFAPWLLEPIPRGPESHKLTQTRFLSTRSLFPYVPDEPWDPWQ